MLRADLKFRASPLPTTLRARAGVSAEFTSGSLIFSGCRGFSFRIRNFHATISRGDFLLRRDG
jgi:hypothetical protein